MKTLNSFVIKKFLSIFLYQLVLYYKASLPLVTIQAKAIYQFTFTIYLKGYTY